MPQIELTGVSKTYHNHVSARALSGVSLALEKGEFAAAVGPSGSGKTTLLNLIGAIDTPDSGIIRIAGLEITSTPASQLAEFRLRHCRGYSVPAAGFRLLAGGINNQSRRA